MRERKPEFKIYYVTNILSHREVSCMKEMFLFAAFQEQQSQQIARFHSESRKENSSNEIAAGALVPDLFCSGVELFAVD